MFLVDDILLCPIHGIHWIARKVNSAAQQELADESESITAELSELYMMLETGQITEAAFDAREKELLDRLDEIQEDGTVAANEEEEGDNGRSRIHSGGRDRPDLPADTRSAPPPVRG